MEANLKQYRLSCGRYRHFTVSAKNSEQAIALFHRASRYGHYTVTMGFGRKDITNIQEV